MKENRFAHDRVGQLDRRTLLKLTGAAAGGSVAATAVGSARRRGGGGGGGGGKSGGRGHTSSAVYLEEPFTVSNPRHWETNASCMSAQSAQQDYTKYDLDYCNRDDDDGYTICVIPDQSRVNEDRVYEFRSKQECKSENQEFQHKFSFGPSNSDHDC